MFLIIFILAAGWTVIFSTVEIGILYTANQGLQYWWVTPCYLKYHSQNHLNAFGRWIVSLVLWILNPVWTIICFIRFLCTVKTRQLS